MNHKTSLATRTAVAALLATSAPASATTFCVPSFHAGCPDNGTNVAEPGVEAPMSTGGSDGIADMVLIGPGTFTDTNSINPSGSDPLTVRGAGTGQTELTTSSTEHLRAQPRRRGNGRLIDVHDLTVVVRRACPIGGGAKRFDASSNSPKAFDRNTYVQEAHLDGGSYVAEGIVDFGAQGNIRLQAQAYC